MKIFDFTLSLIFLSLSVPIFLIISIIIKLESKGPIFFIHERIGLKGTHFKLIKFRTMYTNSDPYEKSPKDSNDNRITIIGRVIRNLGLDELPQLINVLNGEMSLVGPRPEMDFIVKKYSFLQRKRLTVKPGITGLWQIMASNEVPIHENIKYDLYYIQKKTLSFDFWIMYKTLPVIFLGKKRMNASLKKKIFL